MRRRVSRKPFDFLLIFVLACSIFGAGIAIAAQITKTVNVKYYFPRDGTQNPQGTIDGVTPNWFYYWRDALNQNSPTVQYNPNIVYGSTNINGVKIGDKSNLSFSVPYNHTVLFGYPRPTADGKSGSDLFATVMAHELQHLADFQWINSNPGAADSDGDGLPDTLDPFPSLINGAGLSEYTVAGDWEYRARQVEGVLMPTNLDWACPGKQCP